MVKKKVGGGKRYKAALAKGQQGGSGGGAAEVDASTSGSHADVQPQALPAQHLQRKVNRKVKFLERVAASKQAALQTKGTGVKKKRKRKPLPDLSALAGTLDELLAEQKSGKGAKHKHVFGGSVKRNTVRTIIAAKESERMQKVLKHPDFQANPILAVTKHLQATLPAQPVPKSMGKQKHGSQKIRKMAA